MDNQNPAAAPTEPAAQAAPPPSSPSPDSLAALLGHSETLLKQFTHIFEESAELMRQETRLAVASGIVASRWLVAAAIAAVTCWFGLNVAVVALLMEAGLSLAAAVLIMSAIDAALAWYAHELAGRCLDDMRFVRVRRLLKGQTP